MAIPVVLFFGLAFIFVHSMARAEGETGQAVTGAKNMFHPDLSSSASQEPLPPPPPPPSATNVLKPAANGSHKKVFKFVEQMPRFPGGDAALMKFLHDHIRYPAAARENGIDGTIVIQFVVNTDGSIDHIKTVGARKGGGLEEESIRVVKEMPNWKPGRQNGHKVMVQYSLPIRFMLQ